MRSKELELATKEEIGSALIKQGVTNIRSISLRKGEKRIHVNNYILKFNQPHNPKKVNISYCLKRVKQYVPAPPSFFKCQKYEHRREDCRGRQTCAKCSEKDPDHLEEDSMKQFRYANCRQDHPAYIRSCDVYKKENEILEVKHKRNVSFLEAWKIVGRKQLFLFCMEGRYNQWRQQI